MKTLEVGKRYSRQQLDAMFQDSLSRYSHLYAMTSPGDSKLVHLLEEHPGGNVPFSPGWTPYEMQYNDHVVRAGLFGNWHSIEILTGDVKCTQGRTDLHNIILTPEQVLLKYYGQGGASTSVLSRALAPECDSMQLIEGGYGGDSIMYAELAVKRFYRVIIGVDDTDTQKSGATWDLVLRISQELDAIYLGQTNTQLWFKSPYKTKNCVSTGLMLAVEPSKLEAVINQFRQMLTERTLSDEAAFSVAVGTELPLRELEEYTIKAKAMKIEIEEVKSVAQSLGLILEGVKKDDAKGLVGALAAIYYMAVPNYQKAMAMLTENFKVHRPVPRAIELDQHDSLPPS